MRLVIDMQGAQFANQFRGLGRYSLSIVKALIANAPQHEIIIVLSAASPDSIETIRAELEGVILPQNIYIWYPPKEVSYLSPNTFSRAAAQVIRQEFFKSLQPDVILLTNIFGEYEDETIVNVDDVIPTAVIFYDLIRLIYSDIYLANNILKKWYKEKLQQLVRADMLLAISESSRKEAIKFLDINEQQVINISSAASEKFKKLKLTQSEIAKLKEQYNLTKPFLMYTGGTDYRKNIDKLLSAYSKLPENIRQGHQLCIVGKVSSLMTEKLMKLAKKAGLKKEEIIFTGYVSDEVLVKLYNVCQAFIFPSWHEGFGLPVLEAMQCGCAVIASNKSSIPEVLDYEDALFDPYDEQSISQKIERVLTDNNFREKLIAHAEHQVKNFSWNMTAQKTMRALEKLNLSHLQQNKTLLNMQLKLAYISAGSTSNTDIQLLAELNKHYEVDVVTDQKNNHTAITIEQFIKNRFCYDRIIYQLNHFVMNADVRKLITTIPGVIIVEDISYDIEITNQSLGVINYLGDNLNERIEAIYANAANNWFLLTKKIASLPKMNRCKDDELINISAAIGANQ